jgi:hypothetical protein
MMKAEIEQMKAELGCGSRRLFQLYDQSLGREYSSELSAAAQAADAAYEALKRVLNIMEEQEGA